jgi:hypothetical protein
MKERNSSLVHPATAHASHYSWHGVEAARFQQESASFCPLTVSVIPVHLLPNGATV